MVDLSESCTIYARALGVEAPDFIRTITGHTKKCGGGSVTFSKGLKATAIGSGEPLSVKGKGLGRSGGLPGTAGSFSVTNGAGFSGIHVYRDEATQLVTRFTLDPNLPETENGERSSAEVVETPADQWTATPVMIGASESVSVQKQATRLLQRPLGPRCLYRLRIKVAADCDDGGSYIQDIQGDFVQRFVEEDGTVILMFTNTEAKFIDPETLRIVDEAEVVTEPAVSDVLPPEAFPEPEHHAIIVKEEDLPAAPVITTDVTGAPVVVTEDINPETGDVELVERPIVGEGGAGQAPLSPPPEIVYVEENAQQPAVIGVPEDEIIVAGRRYVRARNSTSRKHVRYTKRTPARGTRAWPSKFGKSTTRVSAPRARTRNFNQTRWNKTRSTGVRPRNGRKRDRGVEAFGLDVERKPDWKWGRTENIIVVSSIVIIAVICGAIYWKKKVQLEEARREAAARVVSPEL